LVITPRTKYFAIAVDLGKHGESTAFALVERWDPPNWDEPYPSKESSYSVIGLRRFAPGMEYLTLADEIDTILKGEKVSKVLNQKTELRENGCLCSVRVQLDWVVDQTAVGAPVAQMVLDRLRVQTCRRVKFGSGDSVILDGSVYCIPKEFLISQMLVLLEREKLQFDKNHAESPQVKQELLNYQNRKTASVAQISYNTWRERPNDDRVFAVGLATWRLQTPISFRYDQL
jgi:hypothetical protein